MSRSATGVAFHLDRRGVGLWLLHASPTAADMGHPLARGVGCSIPREARESPGPPALTSYFSARSRRRFLVNGSAFLARPRASTARCLKNSLSIDTPHATVSGPHAVRLVKSHPSLSVAPHMYVVRTPAASRMSRPHTALRLRAVRMRFNQCGDLLDFSRVSMRIPSPQRLRGRDVTGRSTSRLYAPIDLSSFQHCPVRPRRRTIE